MKLNRLNLVAVLAIFAAFPQPRSSRGGDIYGTWEGGGTYFIRHSIDGRFVSTDSGGYGGMLTLDYIPNRYEVNIDIAGYSLLGHLSGNTNNPFGPNSASASIIADSGPAAPPSVGNFAVSYQSILPSGLIENTGDGGSADLVLYEVDEYGTGESVTITFSGTGVVVPEPSSIVLALTGVLMIGLAAWSRRIHRRARDTHRVAT